MITNLQNSNSSKYIIGLIRSLSADPNATSVVIFQMQVKLYSNLVLFAEIIEHYNPKIIDLHNYITSGSISQKVANWNTLNRNKCLKLGKVLTKLKMGINSEEI